MSVKNINDEISRCIIQMLVSEPFYAHLLSGIVRVVTNDIPTAAVGLNNTKVTLYVNENKLNYDCHETNILLKGSVFEFD